MKETSNTAFVLKKTQLLINGIICSDREQGKGQTG
jgi:hypothetical protein